MASSNSPCAACKFLRRKCTQECVFAPYFPPDQPVKFANVHKVFGASNVAKILNELNASQREDAVNSLAYEAEARLRDPVYGCVGLISILQTRLKQVQTDLLIAKQELCAYIGQSPAIAPGLNPAFIQQYQNMQLQHQQQQQQQPSPAMLTLQGPTGNNFRDAHHQQQVYEAHQRQLIEAAREQEMLRNFEHQQRLQDQLQQQQHQAVDLMRFNRGFDVAGAGSGAGTSGQPQVNSSGYTQLTGPGPIVSPSLALGGGYDHSNMYQIHRQPEHELQHHRQPEHELQHHQQPPHEHHQQLQLLPQHLMLQHQPQQPPAQPHQGEGSEEKKSGGPSC